ncbi:MAG: nickel-responsive transcriptional regulator NikR, partial [Patescibacteria group bacterium]
QHEYERIVVSVQHAHLDHDNCLESILVRGKAEEVSRFVRRLRSLKGLKHAALVSATAGR